MRENPGQSLVLCLKKLNNAFRLFPYAATFESSLFVRRVHLLSYGLAPFAGNDAAQMKHNLPINPIRSVRFRYHRFLGLLVLASSGTRRRGRVDAIGRPIVQVFPGSSICLGRDVSMISASFATALGVNHPVVLRTLRPGAQIRIADRVGISGGSICAAQLIEIGEDTMLGANVTIADTDFHSLRPDRRSGHTDPSIGAKEVIIGKRVFIGTNSVILKGVTIGDNTIIGAGSVVTRSVPANSIAAGNPCRVIRELTAQEVAP
jgi:acetyltransferase-like isoleucine patch superfamily enzyme